MRQLKPVIQDAADRINDPMIDDDVQAIKDIVVIERKVKEAIQEHKAQVSKDKVIRVKLHPESKIEVRFPYISDSVLYAYCNKHGLWKKIVEW